MQLLRLIISLGTDALHGFVLLDSHAFQTVAQRTRRFPHLCIFGVCLGERLLYRLLTVETLALQPVTQRIRRRLQLLQLIGHGRDRLLRRFAFLKLYAFKLVAQDADGFLQMPIINLKLLLETRRGRL